MNEIMLDKKITKKKTERNENVPTHTEFKCRIDAWAVHGFTNGQKVNDLLDSARSKQLLLLGSDTLGYRHSLATVQRYGQHSMHLQIRRQFLRPPRWRHTACTTQHKTVHNQNNQGPYFGSNWPYFSVKTKYDPWLVADPQEPYFYQLGTTQFQDFTSAGET